MEETVLEINCDHLYQFDQGLYRQLEDYPCDIIPIFDLVVTQCFKEIYLYSMVGMGGKNQNDGN